MTVQALALRNPQVTEGPSLLGYRFLVRPSPLFQESAFGYLLRVVEANGFVSPRQLWTAMRENANRNQLVDLCQRLELSSLAFESLFGPLPAYWHATTPCNGLSIAEFNHSAMRWCPLCLKKSHHLHAYWSIKLCCVCVHHGCTLCESCPQCGQAQKWERASISKCSECGYNLANTIIKSASEDIAQLHRAVFFAGSEEKVDYYPSLEMYAWLKLIRYLGQFTVFSQPSRPGQISGLHNISAAESIMSNVALLLKDWPVNFEKLLMAIQSQHISSSIRRTFGSIYHVIYFHLRESPYQFLRDAFEQYLHSHWWGLICKRNRWLKPSTIEQHPQLALKYMAKRAEVATSLIKNLSAVNLITHHQMQLPSGRQSKSVHLAELPYIEAMTQDAMDLQSTAKYLAISERVVRILVSAGIIQPLVNRKHLKVATWLFSKQSLKMFWLNPALSEPEVLVPLSTVIKCWRLKETELIALICALLSGELKTYAISLQPVVLGHVNLNRVVTSNWLNLYRKNSGNAMSVDAAAERLGLKQQVVYHLVNVGLIGSFQTPHEGRRINEAALTLFNTHYVALAALAKSQGTSPRALLNTLKIKPITGPQVDGGRQYFYLRKQLEMLESAHA
ncbi:MAG: MerR family transcriptional regulator [Methylotenera sp.]|nr:MerR family transcriptional regulator [Methylotenera sp.]